MPSPIPTPSYTGVVHKGFDADSTAEELIRRYPAFEETEQHRKFLVRSISKRLALPGGEIEDYFTPEQLWEEEDRLNGKGGLLEKEELESGEDEEEEDKDEQSFSVAPIVETANEPDLPITLKTGDHTTTITRECADVQLLLDSSKISPAVPLRAITHCTADGSLVLALLGHLPTTTTTTTCTLRTTEREEPSCRDEWTVVSECPQSPAVAFFSGTETCSDLLEEICWAPDSMVATSLVYDDGRLLVVLVGEHVDLETNPYGITTRDGDPAEEFEGFFGGVRREEKVPVEHAELASLLQVAERDMVEVGALL